MMRRLPIFVVVLFALCALSAVLGLTSLWYERTALLRSAETRLAEVRAKRIAPGEAETRRRALAMGPDTNAGLLVASDSAEVQSRLEEAVRSAVQLHDGRLEAFSLEKSPGRGVEGIARATVHLGIGRHRVEELVQSLESGLPTIFFEKLNLVPDRSSLGDERSEMIMLATILVYVQPPSKRKESL